MGKNSKIEWTDDTWNPWQGCIKVSSGCLHCYMYRDKKRWGQNPRRVVRSAPATFNAPLTKLKGPLIFTCSWSDFFIEHADAWRDEAWDIIRRTPHTYLILTKRPELIATRLPDNWGDGWPNVWLGVSVESNEHAWRVDELTHIPAVKRFISYEPAIGPLYVGSFMKYRKIHWIIDGGESGPGFRPPKLKWFRHVRDFCELFGIAYFHKQNGGNKKIDGAWGGRLLDGRIHDERPCLDAMAV